MRLILRGVVILAAYIFSKKDDLKEGEKLRPFECGFMPYNNRRGVFRVQFFLVTLVFLIFDVELVILFPFLKEIEFQSQFFRFFIVLLFLLVLTLGLILE